MKTGVVYPNARAYVDSLAGSGCYHFTSSEAQSSLGVSAAAAKLALNRLAKQTVIASPARGFHVIIPPEYRSIGCLPADQFLPSLMQSLGLSYYAGLLSAAQYYGAAHHRPQEFQIFLAGRRRPIQCGAVRVAFFARKRASEIPIQTFNTPRGVILVSTPEATAFDLVGYQVKAGGLDQVATLLAELAERIDSDRLAAVAPLSPIPWAQRLGYLLDHVGFESKTDSLNTFVQKHAKQTTLLLPSAASDSPPRNKRWKIYVNVDVKAEL